MSNILHRFFNSYPTPQNALDIFKDEWSSKLPGDFAKYAAGFTPLFEDDRIHWAISELGGVKDKTILELGPLEGGHTYMLENNGAKSIIAIEANSKAFLKCLITKELLVLQKSKFLCGNFLEYVKNTDKKFDVCFASGVLYHLKNPVDFIHDLSKISDNIFIWTHYFDKNAIMANKNNIAQKFPSSKLNEIHGFKHILYRYEYQNALDWRGFSGGTNESSNWLSKEDILNCLKSFGYSNIKINFEEPNHQNGPALAIVAQK